MVCSKNLKKYFYIIGAVAVLILVGAYWYTGYYTKGFGAVSAPPGAVNMFPQIFPGAGAAMRTPAFPVRVPTPAPIPAPALVPAPALAPVLPAPAAFAPAMVRGGDFSIVAMALRNSVVNVTVSRTASGASPAPMAPVAQAPGKGDGEAQFATPLVGGVLENVGSGVIVRSDGYILTNYHVVRGAAAAFVTVFDDVGTQRYSADIVKMDETLDLALLKITPRAPLVPAVLGDSDRVRVAEEVITIGSPFGLDQTVSRGIVAGRRKALVIENVTHANLIQTDAAINQGNSGGPLVSIDGQVIGINTAIYTPTGAFSGVGFAIPSNHARRFVESMITLPDTVAVAQTAALPGGGGGGAAPPISASARAPHTDGREALDCASCHQITGKPAGGAPVAFQYQFARPPASLAVNVATANAAGPAVVPGAAAAPGAKGPAAAPAEAGGFPIAGAVVYTITPTLAQRIGARAGEGVFVASVQPGSFAADAKLAPGDVVLKVDGRRVATPAQLAAAFKEVRVGDMVRLSLVRDGQRQDVKVTVGTAIDPPAGGAGAGATAAGAKPGVVPTEFAWLGMEIETFTRVPLAADPQGNGAMGALVSEIVASSKAAKAGILAGDVILEVNNQSVGTAAALNTAIRGVSQRPNNLVKISRNGAEFFVVM
ncbi:MAG: trypsin-like peptidase domain-containing protein [Alphaproteobacteria bacterium]